MMIPIPTATPLGVVALTINFIAAPLVGWLVKSGRKAARKITEQGVKVRALEKQVDKLQSASDAAEPRLARLETAICNIERSALIAEKQHAAVMQKLEQLPRLATLLEMYSTAIAAIVPRPEADGRFSGLEERMRMVESDIRKGGNREA